jgi:hypothetical protein
LSSRVSVTAVAVLAVLVSSQVLAAPVNQVPRPSATFDGAVLATAYWGDVIYIGGEFLNARVNGSSHRRDRLAAIDARSGALLDWKPSADAAVTAIAADATGVYAGGAFTTVNLQSRDSLVKLTHGTGSVLPGFKQRIYGHINAIAVGSGRIYAGGTITSVNKLIRHRVAAFDANSGELDTAWAPVLDGTVHSLLAGAQRIYLGGMFSEVNGVSKTQKLAAVRPDSGQVDTGFVSRITSFVASIAEHDGTLYAGIDGTGGRATAMALDGTPKWTVTMDGDIGAIAVLDGVVYAGGHFDNVCRTSRVGGIEGLKGSHCLEGSDPRVKLAAFDLNGALLPWTANGNGSTGVRTLTANAGLGQVVAGGHFTTVNGAIQKRFALFSLS